MWKRVMLVMTVVALAGIGCAEANAPGTDEGGNESEPAVEGDCGEQARNADGDSDRVLALRALTPPLQGGVVEKLPSTVVFADGRVITRDPDVIPGSADYPAFLEQTMSDEWLEALLRDLCPEVFARLPASLGSPFFDYGGQEDVVIGVAYEGELHKARALGLRDPDEELPQAFEKADAAIAGAAREVRQTGTRADIDDNVLPTVEGGSITEG